ncbi:sigma-70 family RNA polymerase sigma factor [Parabacteroides sp. OttesenSCG-928-N08]|nr:sigma-70 family RNA polymerase sigma factor [Parabacteroides sp. OttesenSCG-928-N08]
MSGSDKAFGELYKNYTQFLYEYGMRFTSDSDLVKDCIHDLFLKIYKQRKTLIRPANIKVYLLVSLKNQLLNVLKQSSRYQQSDDEEGFFSFSLSVEEEYIEDERQRMERQLVDSFLSVLSPRQKEVIYYRYLQELSIQDICLLMNINYQSAQNLIQKALSNLRSRHNIPLLLPFLILCS